MSSVTPPGDSPVEPTAPGGPPPTDPPSDAAPGINWLIPTLSYVLTLGIFGVTSKLALEHLSWQGLIFWSGVGYLLAVGFMLARGIVRPQIVPGTGWAILAGFSAISTLVAFYIALTHGPASEIVPISAAYPAVTVILGAIFLRERVSVARVAGLVMVIGGVVMVTIN